MEPTGNSLGDETTGGPVEMLTRWFAPETLLPVQFEALWGQRAEVSPVRALALAVLWRAFDDIQQYRAGKRDAEQKRAYADARQWALADEPAWPFSFVNLCDVLDLSPDALRAALLGPGQRPRPPSLAETPH